MEMKKDVTENRTVSYKDMLDAFNSIPRKPSDEILEKKSQFSEEEKENIREQKAIQDIRRLLALLEKRMIGKLDERDLKEMNDNAMEWMDSIFALKKYIENYGIK